MKIKDYFTPKSLVYTGMHRNVETQINHYAYNKDDLIVSDTLDLLPGYNHYIQVIGLSDISKIELIKQKFNIDTLVIEDILNVKQRNKIEVFQNYVFAVFHIEYLNQNTIVKDYLSILLFENTLISFHEKNPHILLPLQELFVSYKDLKEHPVDFLFYQILDIITDAHIDVFDDLEDQMLNFESMILETKQIDQESFYHIRKHLLALKSNVSHIIDPLEEARKESTLLSNHHIRFFDDLHDHLIRLDAQINQARETMRNLLDLHMNNQSTKMNRIMTTLTLFSAIFIPLSFLSGFFGMNFVHFELLNYRYALLVFVVLCMILASFMVYLFKKMKWF